MKLQVLDLAIVAVYLLGTIFLGFFLRKQASQNLDSYYLGGRKLPWWILGLGGSSNYFDVTGTMLLVSVLLTGGLKFLLWEVHFGWHFIAMAVFMAYMGKWVRRSGVITSAEWLKFRFGDGTEGKSARLTFAIFLILINIATLVYTAVGMTKFIEIMFPEFNPKIAVAALFIITGFYTTLAGMIGTAYNDILQTILITVASLIVAISAFINVPAETIHNALPKGWNSLRLELGEASAYFFIAWFIRSIMRSMCGPMYFDSQSFLSARSAREAAKVALLWNIGHSFRWVIVVGFIVFALGGMVNLETAKSQDAEKVLPQTLQLMGTGTIGLLLAGMLAAFMSTFDSLVNCIASFFVRDIYQEYLKPAAKDKELVIVSYITSAFVIVLSTVLSFGIQHIGTVWLFLIFGLEIAIIFPNFLRWHWWRFNGYGYTAGIIAILVLVLVMELSGAKKNIDMNLFITITALAGLVVSIVTSLVTSPTNQKTLEEFAKKTKPFGIWGPFSNLIKSEPDRSRCYDILNLFLCIVWYLSLNLMPVFFLLKYFDRFAISAATFICLSTVLYFTWWKTLPND